MKFSDLSTTDAVICVTAGLVAVGAVVACSSMAYKIAYCNTLDKQHVQHRNATAAMGAELDRRFGMSGHSYEDGSVGLSDAMFNSLKRSNECS